MAEHKTMIEYGGMTPETMYWYDTGFRLRAEDSLADVPAFTATGELEAMHVVQRVESRVTEKGIKLVDVMRRYAKERERQVAQGALVLRREECHD